MNDLPLTSAQSIIRKSWEKMMSKKKLNEAQFRSVVKKTCPSRKNFNQLFNLLSPYIFREREMSELKNEPFIKNGFGKKISNAFQKVKSSVDSRREDFRKKLEASRKRGGDNLYAPK